MFFKKSNPESKLCLFQFYSEHATCTIIKDYSESKGYGIKFLISNSVEHDVGNLCRKGIGVRILPSNKHIINFIEKELPKIFFSSSRSIVNALSRKYNIEFEKKYKFYKLVRC